jgi:threonine/homoserine/homoserine lactone efflux protein
VVGLFLAGLGLGVLLAAQIGPVTLLIVRSVLRGGRALLVGLAMAAAVTLVDLLYATVGLLGVGALLAGDTLQVAFGLASAGVLIVIGVRTAWTGVRARLGHEWPEDVLGPRKAFVTAVAATALNPLTIALWTISFPAAVPSASGASLSSGVAVLAGVLLGTLSWYGGLSAAVALARNRVGPRLLAGVDVVTGTLLTLYGGHLGYRAVHER